MGEPAALPSTLGAPVIIVTSTYPPVVGGMERFCRDLAGELARRGVPVSILTRRVPGTPAVERADGVEVHRLRVPRPRVAAAGAFIAGAVGWLARARPSRSARCLLHCHSTFSPATIGILAKPLIGARVVVTAHTGGLLGEVWEHQRSPLRGIRRVLLRRADAFTGVTEETARELGAFVRPRSPVRVIPNFVDVGRFRPAADPAERARLRARLGLDPRRPVGLFVGRLNPVKNVDLILDAVAILGDAAPDVLIVGDGPEGDRLRRRAGELGLGGRVRFVGARPDVEAFLRAADLFVLPSVSEGVPLALLEAMASGLPVIATAVGGIRQLVQDGTTGLQVQSEDPKGLAQAMARVLDDRGLAERLGRGAREWAVGHVAPERVVGEYLELYRQVLRG